MSAVDAVSLLSRVASGYATMSSYSDDGIVLQTSEGSNETHKTEFVTIFRRPSMFRFKFSSPHPYPPLSHVITSHICGSDGSKAYVWTKAYDRPSKTEVKETLSMAVASVTGISGGSAHTIGALLIPEIGGFRFQDLERPSAIREEMFEGALCVVIQAHHPRGSVVSAWIDHETLTLRKVSRNSGVFVSNEIRRNVRVGETIPDSEFALPNSET
jgi:hypothetical protein